MDLHDEWLSSTRKYIKFDQWETGKTLYSILHRIMDLTNYNQFKIIIKIWMRFFHFIELSLINIWDSYKYLLDKNYITVNITKSSKHT